MPSASVKLRVVAAAAVALAVPHKAEPAAAHVSGCHTTDCDRRVHRHRAVRWLHRHPLRYATSTAYCPGSSGSITADGSHVAFGLVAMNTLPLGSWIRFEQPVHGRSRFRVADRIGSGSQLDIWMSTCALANAWGRRQVAYRVIG